MLLVEDDAALRESVAALLREEGAEVMEVDTLAAARRALRQGFDLVLLDHILPDGFGSDLCRTMRAERQGARPACVLFSALHDVERIARDAGADAWFAKPFDVFDFLAKLDGLLAANSA